MRRLALVAMVFLGAAAPPPGAASCSGCHGPAALPINGQSAGALSAAMLAYRGGERPSTLMGRLMQPLTPEEIAAIAAWVSEQSG